MDVSKITNVEVDGIDFNDYPDFCDAYILSAEINGVKMTEEELDELNEDSEFVHEKVYAQLY